MDCKYNYKGQELTESQLEEQYRKDNENDIDFFQEPLLSVSREAPVPIMGAYLKFKQDLLDRDNKMLSSIRSKKIEHSQDIEKISSLNRMQETLEERKVKLLREIAEIEESDTVVTFSRYAEEDLKKLESLANSKNPHDFAQAKVIIGFYKKLSSLNDNNPMFQGQDLTDGEGNVLISQESQDILNDYANRAVREEARIFAKEESFIQELLNSNRKIKGTFGENGVSYSDAFFTEEGLKDASWLDMFIMDITNGIASHNGIVPQVMMNILQNSMEQKLNYAKYIEQEVNRLQPEVEKELKKIPGEKYEVIGLLGLKGVRYDIFRAKDENGNYQDGMTQRYSTRYLKSLQAMERNYRTSIEGAESKETDKLKQAAYKLAVDNRNDWFRKNTEVVDITKLSEVLEEFKDYSGELKLDETKVDSAYRQKLVDLLGSEKAYLEELEKVRRLIKSYLAARNSYMEDILSEEEVTDVNDLSPKGKQRLKSWESRHNPSQGVVPFSKGVPEQVIEYNNAVRTTPSVDFSKGSSSKSVYVNTDEGNINIETRTLDNAKEGDQLEFINTGTSNKLVFVDEDGAVYSSTYSITIKFNGTSWDAVQASKMSYNYAIPKKETPSLAGDKMFSTGYYDARFAQIEASPVLLEFQKLIMELQETIYHALSPEDQQKLNTSSLPTLRKSLMEILSNPELSSLQKLSEAYHYIIEKILGMFGKNIEPDISNAIVDPITGRPDYTVGTSFLKTNKTTIDGRYGIQLQRMSAILLNDPLKVLGQYEVFNLDNMDVEARAILAEAMGVVNTVKAIKERTKGEDHSKLEVGRILKEAITHQVVKEQSFDLPKIMKLYSYVTMEYAARQDVLPTLNILKQHYDRIERPDTTNDRGVSIKNKRQGGVIRKAGERKRAQEQMESWFQRAVLGNYNSKSEFGDTGLKRDSILGVTGQETIDRATKKAQKYISGRILTREDKEQIRQLRDAKSRVLNAATPNTKEGQEQLQEKLRAFQEREDSIGKKFSGVAFFDAIFNFIRLKGLGWNVSSYVTNFMEGQVSNMIVAASGDYFTPENIYKANSIVKYSFLKSATNGKIAIKGSKLTSILMRRYAILQDASNEMQKASYRTAFSGLEVLSPYEGTKRTEFLNQAPLMIAVLMDQKIKDKDGNESSVWDAMNEDGTLKEEFRVGSNVDNWENSKGAGYEDFSSHMRKLIVNAHGDYDNLRGNMATEYSTGKALLMFKRWMSRQFYQRFAWVEQTDIEVGIKDYKGRYLSHTQTTGMLHGAILGFGGLSLLGMGPFGLFLGGSAGLLLGKFAGANSSMNFMQELTVTLKALATTALGIPVNNITGKAIIKSTDLEVLKGKDFTERDMRNMRANLVDIAITCAWTALLLFTKMTLWDDDDEEDSAKRRAHNLFANKFMQMSSQASMYLNPVDAWENTAGSLPLMRFLGELNALSGSFQQFLEGNDTMASGPNAGGSNLARNASKAFMPGFFKDPMTLGFGSQMDRQFEVSFSDKWFWSEEKIMRRRLQAARKAYRNELEENGMPPKQSLAEANRTMPYPKEVK